MYLTIYTKQRLMEQKEEIENSTITTGNLNMLLSVVDRMTIQGISKEIKDLNNTIYQLDLTDIYRIYHP